MDSKRKKKAKKPPEKKRDKKQSPEDPQGPKKNYQKKKNKGEMNKCAYCNKGNHTKIFCMKKKMTPGEEWHLPSRKLKEERRIKFK